MTRHTALAEVRATAAAIAPAREAATEAVQRRDVAIRAALAAGVSAADVAEAAKLSAFRVYQIRGGRR